MAKTYSMTREVAWELLWVSTRTIDRYIKSGRLSYKKIANKVLLAQEEVSKMWQEFSALHQQLNTEIIGGTANEMHISPNIEQSIDEKIDKFFLIFKEKDKMLEEKNKIIFMLQQRVAELETKLQHMIALPDYNKEKQQMLLEKEKLENKIDQLQWVVKTEKNKNLVLVWLALIFVAIAWFLFIKG